MPLLEPPILPAEALPRFVNPLFGGPGVDVEDGGNRLMREFLPIHETKNLLI